MGLFDKLKDTGKTFAQAANKLAEGSKSNEKEEYLKKFTQNGLISSEALGKSKSGGNLFCLMFDYDDIDCIGDIVIADRITGAFSMKYKFIKRIEFADVKQIIGEEAKINEKGEPHYTCKLITESDETYSLMFSYRKSATGREFKNNVDDEMNCVEGIDTIINLYSVSIAEDDNKTRDWFNEIFAHREIKPLFKEGEVIQDSTAIKENIKWMDTQRKLWKERLKKIKDENGGMLI